jgi:LPXTG-site transpeptidase (sortase) family protein
MVNDRGPRPRLASSVCLALLVLVASCAPLPALRSSRSLPKPHADARFTRLAVPVLGIDAPVQEKGVDSRNRMEEPDTKDVVAWYHFTSKPGFGSNAVISGHVDWYGTHGVFARLRELKVGDEVVLEFSDGVRLTYRVTSTEVWPLDNAPVRQIVGPTREEVVTLITCEGQFDRERDDYDARRVVRAKRVS